MRCDVCHKSLNVGEWPFCPHGKLDALGGQRWSAFEPRIDNLIAEQPVQLTSPGQRDRIMRERGLEVRPREHINDLNQRRYLKGLPPLPR